MKGKDYLLGTFLLAASGGLLLLPGARRLPGYAPTTLDGVRTIENAAAACRRTGLQGWELVAYAQKLVARKFVVYSTLNLWDTPARAFLMATFTLSR